MQRVIIAYNPRSSRQLRIQKEVIRPLAGLGGYQVGKYEVKKISVNENAKMLAQLLMDGDLLISAGGDGTSTMALNAAMLSKKDVTLGVLGYGNFNDCARMLGEKNCKDLIYDFENGSVQRLFPMEAFLDGEHWRYAACYFTVGMFAESTEAFNKQEIRDKLKRGKKGLIYSILVLAKWFFRNKKRDFLPKDIQLGNVPMNRMKISKSGKENIVQVAPSRRVSDVLMVNSKTVARLMRGGNYWQNPDEIFVSYGRLKSFWRLMWFMMRSIVAHLPGKKYCSKKDEESRGDVIVKVDFSGPEEFEIQAEGEYSRVKAKELVIKKDTHGIKVVCR